LWFSRSFTNHLTHQLAKLTFKPSRKYRVPYLGSPERRLLLHPGQQIRQQPYGASPDSFTPWNFPRSLQPPPGCPTDSGDTLPLSLFDQAFGFIVSTKNLSTDLRSRRRETVHLYHETSPCLLRNNHCSISERLK